MHQNLFSLTFERTASSMALSNDLIEMKYAWCIKINWTEQKHFNFMNWSTGLITFSLKTIKRIEKHLNLEHLTKLFWSKNYHNWPSLIWNFLNKFADFVESNRISICTFCKTKFHQIVLRHDCVCVCFFLYKIFTESN